MDIQVIKRNERDWAGQLISWIKSAIDQGTTIFQDATNDTGVKLSSGKTKFPDILLFTNKTSGEIFNGWELKFPDTAVDDETMLENALEKAQKLHSNSFVTWNGSEAVIWGIDTTSYTIEGLSKIKHYPKVPTISVRDDLANPISYAKHEHLLKERANEILHDLGQLFKSGELKPALDISGNIIEAIRKAYNIIVPQFREAIIEKKGMDSAFRKEFAKWRIYEGATLTLLSNSSRRAVKVDAEEVLAKFTFYNLIGKILFYLTLSDNLSRDLPPMEVGDAVNAKDLLNGYFDKAGEIDYQAVFKPYFTDDIPLSQISNNALLSLLQVLTEVDFHILPSKVIGHILENLVPKEEKQKFGQYFTPEILAKLVAFPAIKNRNSILFDPTSGTGTFLSAFYDILKYHGNTNHITLLNQIWGNDVSHFPAILSVINLYKQDVKQRGNFPRVIRDDFFQLKVGKDIVFPDSHDYRKHVGGEIPMFDAIVSNFPFIQQEDIPNEDLVALFQKEFGNTQKAFLRENVFKINERSDYFAYCVYNSLKFLNEKGCIAAITSNAWLGKEYGFQLKRFLLDNFHIRYIVRSNAEHWFKDSQVSTLFFVVERTESTEPTRFVTLNFKLTDYFDQTDINEQISQIESLYGEIDNCSDNRNRNWRQDSTFKDLYYRNDGMVTVCEVCRETLLKSLDTKKNWSEFFVSAVLFDVFDPFLVSYHPQIVKVIRGERTGWNPMFVVPADKVKTSGVAPQYLIPYLKSPSELKTIEFDNQFNYQVFVCPDDIGSLDEGTKKWIVKFKNAPNKNHSATIEQANSGHSPYWYSISPKRAHIITAINPYNRFFFTYSETPFTIDQRLIALQVQQGYDVELIAALLNSVLTFLTLEMRGTSRNLGALDLNANYLKQLRVLNPALLSEDGIAKIKAAFEPLKHREIGTIAEEIKKGDRRNFDKVVLRAYGIDDNLLGFIYGLLESSVKDRVEMIARR